MKILKIAKVGLITGTLGYECHGGMSVGDDERGGGREMERLWGHTGERKGGCVWRGEGGGEEDGGGKQGIKSREMEVGKRWK